MSILSKLFQSKFVVADLPVADKPVATELDNQKAVNQTLRSELTVLEGKLSDLKAETLFCSSELSKRNKLVEQLTHQALAEIGIQRNYPHE